jgi:hypothetical protein
MPPAARRGSLLLRDMSSTERGLSRICRVPAHQAAAAVSPHATRRAEEQRPAGRRVQWGQQGRGEAQTHAHSARRQVHGRGQGQCGASSTSLLGDLLLGLGRARLHDRPGRLLVWAPHGAGAGCVSAPGGSYCTVPRSCGSAPGAPLPKLEFVARAGSHEQRKKQKQTKNIFCNGCFLAFFPRYVVKKIRNTWGHLVQNLKLTGSCGQLGPWWRCAGRLCARDACSLASSVSGFGCRQRAATAPRRSRATCAAARTRLRTSRCENASARYRNARTLQGPPSPPLPLPSCSFLPCATASCSRGLCAGARRAAERAA